MTHGRRWRYICRSDVIAGIPEHHDDAALLYACADAAGMLVWASGVASGRRYQFNSSGRSGEITITKMYKVSVVFCTLAFVHLHNTFAAAHSRHAGCARTGDVAHFSHAAAATGAICVTLQSAARQRGCRSSMTHVVLSVTWRQQRMRCAVKRNKKNVGASRGGLSELAPLACARSLSRCAALATASAASSKIIRRNRRKSGSGKCKR